MRSRFKYVTRANLKKICYDNRGAFQIDYFSNTIRRSRVDSLRVSKNIYSITIDKLALTSIHSFDCIIMFIFHVEGQSTSNYGTDEIIGEKLHLNFPNAHVK